MSGILDRCWVQESSNAQSLELRLGEQPIPVSHAERMLVRVAGEGGRVIGHLQFVSHDRAGQEKFVELSHVEVDSEFRGQGLADFLVEAGVRYFQAAGWQKIVATCTYIRDKFMPSHPEFGDLLTRGDVEA
eukprot:EC789832.1.p2 GENE.EC789832.1~~EC789832.1.p2  ORF type:complete len:131 (+),score=38.03 EC789832.1:40-432(+)